MAVITDPVTGAPLTVDASLAARSTPYTTEGVADTQRWTYAFCSNLKRTGNNSATTAMLTIYGASGRVIRLKKIALDVTIATTATYGGLYLRRFVGGGGVGNGGTLILGRNRIVSYDSNAPESCAAVGFWSTGPAAPVVMQAQLFANAQAFLPVTATPARKPGRFVFDFGSDAPSQSAIPVISGDDQGIELFWSDAPGNTPTLAFEMIWTEEINDG